MITRTTNDVNQIQMVAQMFLRMMINAPITLIGASFLAYQKDAQLTKIFLVVIPIMIVLVGWNHVFCCATFQKHAEKTDRLNLVFREGLTGVRVIRAFDKTGYEANRFDEANKDYTHTAIKSKYYRGTYDAFDDIDYEWDQYCHHLVWWTLYC